MTSHHRQSEARSHQREPSQRIDYLKLQERIDYRALKERMRIVDLLRAIGWASTEGRGVQLRGPCPLPGCGSRPPSGGSKGRQRTFSIHTSKNIYRCFHCGSSGNVLDFWQAYRGLEFHPATDELYQILETCNHTSLPNQPPNPQR